jgi:molecular chaperone GrpE
MSKHSKVKNTGDDAAAQEHDELVEELNMQVEALTEALQRERADAMNVRRRADEEKGKMANYYKAMVVKSLLPAIDNLERALKHAPKDLADHDYVKGVQGVAKQFGKAFESIGVIRIKTVGEVFDPTLHEAVSMDDGEGDTEVVTEELVAGYVIGDEVVRHSMVRVGLKDIKNQKSEQKERSAEDVKDMPEKNNQQNPEDKETA